MVHRPRRAGVVLGSAVAIVLLGSTSAWAYWTTTGTGSGAAAARTFQAVTVTNGIVSGTLLYPGLTADGTSVGGNLEMTATNPNPFPVTVSVSQDGNATGCTTPDVSLMAGSFTLPANSGAVSRTLTFKVSMGTASSSNCQGATISVPLTTSATSN